MRFIDFLKEKNPELNDAEFQEFLRGLRAKALLEYSDEAKAVGVEDFTLFIQ